MAFQDWKAYKIGETIQTVYPPIFISVGLVGNLVSIIVLCKRKNRRSSTAVLLSGLAVADILVLAVALTEKWVHATFDIDIRATSSAMCKGHVFLTYSLLQLSPWVLVAITVERVCCVRIPHRVKNAFTAKRCMCILVSIATALFSINSHLLYGMETITIAEQNLTICVPRDEYIKFMYFVWPWIDVCLMFAIPCVILIIGNILIYRSLKSSLLFSRSVNGSSIRRKTRSGRVKRRVHVTHTSGSLSSSNESMHGNTASGRLASPVSRESLSRTRSSGGSLPRTLSNTTRTGSRQVKSSSFFSRTMFILNVSFIMCVSPTNIFTIGQTYWYPSPLTDRQLAELYLVSRLCFMFMYFNNVINFFLYILLGPRFRKDVLQILWSIRSLVPCFKSYHYSINIHSNSSMETRDHKDRNRKGSVRSDIWPAARGTGHSDILNSVY